MAVNNGGNKNSGVTLLDNLDNKNNLVKYLIKNEYILITRQFLEYPIDRRTKYYKN